MLCIIFDALDILAHIVWYSENMELKLVSKKHLRPKLKKMQFCAVADIYVANKKDEILIPFHMQC